EVRARQRSQDRVARTLEVVGPDEVPELLELPLLPVRVHEEVAGHAVLEFPRDPRRLERRVDAGVLNDRGEARIRGRFEAEEDVEVLRERTPRFEQLCAAANQVSAGLDEEPALADAALLQDGSELEAPRRMVPEEVVGDKHGVA